MGSLQHGGIDRKSGHNIEGRVIPIPVHSYENSLVAHQAKNVSQTLCIACAVHRACTTETSAHQLTSSLALC